VNPPLAVYGRARALAADNSGHYLDHLANNGAAVDAQAPVGLAAELPADLAWVVLGVGSGAGSRAVGRRLREYPTRVAVVDPENSAYFPGWATDSSDYGTGMPSRIDTVVFVAGDAGESYADTYYDDQWVGAKGWDLTEPTAEVARLLGSYY